MDTQEFIEKYIVWLIVAIPMIFFISAIFFSEIKLNEKLFAIGGIILMYLFISSMTDILRNNS